MTYDILYVDDYPELAETVAEYLEREVPEFSVEIATSAIDALDRLAQNSIDCIISDYEMPEINGLEFLRIVREDHPDLPFLLFTGKGSEEIASNAIAAGVTDYVQKRGDASQYSVLANRAQNAVESYRSSRRLQKLRDRHERVSMASADAFFDWNIEEDELWWSEGLERLFGYTYSEIENDIQWLKDRVHPDDRQRIEDGIHDVLDGEEEFWEAELRFKRADGTYAIVVSRAYAVYDIDDTPSRLTGALIDVTDRKEYERAFDALHDVTRDLLHADSKNEVSQLVVDAASDILDLPIFTIYLFDGENNVLQPSASSEAVQDIIGDPPTFAPGDNIAWQAFVEGDAIRHNDVSDSEQIYDEASPIRSEFVIPLSDHGVFITGAFEIGRFDDQTVELLDFLAATTETALNHVVQTKSLDERDRRLRAQEQELDRLVEMNNQIRSTEQAVVQATTREEIEVAVCESLIEVDRFEFAWIGTFDHDSNTSTPRAWAGGDSSYLDTVFIHGDAGDSSTEPAFRAATGDELHVVANTSSHLREEPWRREALAKGFQSVLSVPIKYDEITYGVLSVYANETDAFDDLSQSVFDELSDTIAYAINAVETKQSLLTDRIVELELEIPESDDCLQLLARQLQCEVIFIGGVLQATGTTRLFVEISGADVDDIRSFAEQPTMIETVNVISDENDHVLLEIIVSGTCLPLLINEHGGNVRSLVAAPDGSQAVIELHHSAGVRQFIEQLQTRFPDTELVARRDRDRPIQTQQTFQDQYLAELTSRQLEVLQTAYLSGYFSWPRESSGENVAESLDIAPPTFHNHLRQAEEEIFSLLLGDEDVSSRSDEG